jgi:hypothetical protein
LHSVVFSVPGMRSIEQSLPLLSENSVPMLNYLCSPAHDDHISILQSSILGLRLAYIYLGNCIFADDMVSSTRLELPQVESMSASLSKQLDKFNRIFICRFETSLVHTAKSISFWDKVASTWSDEYVTLYDLLFSPSFSIKSTSAITQ